MKVLIVIYTFINKNLQKLQTQDQQNITEHRMTGLKYTSSRLIYILLSIDCNSPIEEAALLDYKL